MFKYLEARGVEPLFLRLRPARYRKGCIREDSESVTRHGNGWTEPDVIRRLSQNLKNNCRCSCGPRPCARRRARARAAPGMKSSWEAQPLFPNGRRFGPAGGFSVKSLDGFW